MAYPLASGQFVEVRLLYDLYGQICMNIFHYVIGAGTTADNDMDDFLDGWSNTVVEPLADQMSNDVTNIRVQGQVIAPVRLIAQDYTPGTTAGQDPGDSLPPANAVVLRRNTGLAGRTNRGRIYVAGVPAATTGGGRLLPTPLAEWQLVADVLASPISFGSSRFATPVILGNTATSGPPNWVNRGTVTNTGADDILRVQRRREIGVGQ